MVAKFGNKFANGLYLGLMAISYGRSVKVNTKRQCQKPQILGVGMAVCQKDRAYKHYTNNQIGRAHV